MLSVTAFSALKAWNFGRVVASAIPKRTASACNHSAVVSAGAFASNFGPSVDHPWLPQLGFVPLQDPRKVSQGTNHLQICTARVYPQMKPAKNTGTESLDFGANWHFSPSCSGTKPPWVHLHCRNLRLVPWAPPAGGLSLAVLQASSASSLPMSVTAWNNTKKNDPGRKVI